MVKNRDYYAMGDALVDVTDDDEVLAVMMEYRTKNGLSVLGHLSI